VLVPGQSVVSLGSAVFAFLAAGTFKSIEEAQKDICPSHRVYESDPEAEALYEELYPLYKKVYFRMWSAGEGRFGKHLAGADSGDRTCAVGVGSGSSLIDSEVTGVSFGS
jgi:hypothetical protein